MTDIIKKSNIIISVIIMLISLLFSLIVLRIFDKFFGIGISFFWFIAISIIIFIIVIVIRRGISFGKIAGIIFLVGLIVFGMYLIVTYIPQVMTPSVKLENKIYLASQTGPAKIDYYGDNLRLETGDNAEMAEFVFKTKFPMTHWPIISVVLYASQEGATFQLIAKDAGNETSRTENRAWDAYFSPVLLPTTKIGYGAQYLIGDMSAAIADAKGRKVEIDKRRVDYHTDLRYHNLKIIIKAPPNTVVELSNFSINT